MIAWFLAPYERRDVENIAVGFTDANNKAIIGTMPGRYCVIDDYTTQIHETGGDWAEEECLGNHAVVKVIAPSKLLSQITNDQRLFRLPGVHLTDKLALDAQTEAKLRAKIVELGYTESEIDTAFPNGFANYTLQAVIDFILSRRHKPRYDAKNDEIILDGIKHKPMNARSIDRAVK